MDVALDHRIRGTAGRGAATIGLCGITIAVGVAIALKAPVSGYQLPLLGLFSLTTVWLATTKRTMRALGVVTLYIGLVDGVVKLRTGNEVPTLGRDVLLYAVVGGMALRAKGPVRLPALGGWIVAWCLIVFAQLANPQGGTPLHSVVSLRQHLEFVPLVFVGFAALRTHASLEALFALVLAIAAINGAVAAYQSTLRPEQLATWGPGYAELLSGVAPRTAIRPDGQRRIRPPGLGSDMGFAGVVGATAIPGGIALLLICFRRRRRHLPWLALGLFGAVVAVLTSQSRSAVITAIVAILAMLGLMAVGGQARRSLTGLCLAGSLAAIAVVAIQSYDSGTFYRYASISPNRATTTVYQSREGTWASIPKYMRDIPLGVGLGSGGPAAGLWDNRAVVWNAESQFTFLIIEVGVPGLLIFLAFHAALARTIFAGLRAERDARTVVLMAALCAPLFGFAANWLVGVNTTSTPNAPWLWLAAGAVSYWFVTRRRRESRRLHSG